MNWPIYIAFLGGMQLMWAIDYILKSKSDVGSFIHAGVFAIIGIVLFVTALRSKKAESK
jgi:hypothetical protein